MSVENATSSFPELAAQRRAPQSGDPLAVQVEDLHKTFRIPTHKVDSLKERVVRPFAARDYRELRALSGISFEVRKGEFFGIVGRNGSGKSTLLKLLASIYRADSGTIRIAGRLAPFIELGVGFNQELSGRENVVLNGVMMGLTPQQARSRLDSVIEFAELEEFADLKLKNYSSGMLVRLAFSLMLEVDADVLLIDEVLAVGDAAFQQKCADAFREMKAEGRTIILVTHEMSTVEQFCDRAMLINNGDIQQIGDPGEVGRSYLKLNFERTSRVTSHTIEGAADKETPMTLLDAHLAGAAEGDVPTVEHGQGISFEVELEAHEDFSALEAAFLVANADGMAVFTCAAPITGEDGDRRIRAGQRIKVEVTVENRLTPGHYFVHCGVNRTDEGGVALYVHNALEFLVFGGPAGDGVVIVGNAIATNVESEMAS
jgi:ABC-type polysaccharide/polyol phosphate transport system ATPase subunit